MVHAPAPRRRFLRECLPRTLDSLARACDEWRGLPHLRLPEIAACPEHLLDEMEPVFARPARHRLHDTSIALLDPDGGCELARLPLTPFQSRALLHFGTGMTLGQIAAACATQGPGAAGDDAMQPLADVRRLFVSLARCAICLPAGAPALAPRDEA